jgi:hypothetical protein
VVILEARGTKTLIYKQSSLCVSGQVSKTGEKMFFSDVSDAKILGISTHEEGDDTLGDILV